MDSISKKIHEKQTWLSDNYLYNNGVVESDIIYKGKISPNIIVNLSDKNIKTNGR